MSLSTYEWIVDGSSELFLKHQKVIQIKKGIKQASLSLNVNVKPGRNQNMAALLNIFRMEMYRSPEF